MGFAKFLPRHTFEHPSEGYVLNNCCTFGAEVFVNTSGKTRYRESLLQMPISLLTRIFRYDLVKFSSQFGLEHLFPNLIIVGERKWYGTFTQLNCSTVILGTWFVGLMNCWTLFFSTNCRQLCVYPKGYGQHKDVSLSLYLRSADDLYTLPSVYVEFKLRVVDQAFNLHHIERTGTYFCIFLIVHVSTHWSRLKNLYKFDFSIFRQTLVPVLRQHFWLVRFYVVANFKWPF